MSAQYLKEIAVEIAVPLTVLLTYIICPYNKVYRVSPQEWKQSHITPVHKGGNLDDPSNYKPISVVSVLAKIMEKIVSAQLSSYLEDHQLLHPHQSTYRYG